MSWIDIGADEDPYTQVEQRAMERPVLPGETVADYDARTNAENDLARRQVAAAQKVQQVEVQKGKDVFDRARIPYRATDTTVEPIRDASGAPLREYDKRTRTAWNSVGQPVVIDEQPEGVYLRDPYENAPRKTDKEGNIYAAPEGLAWRDLAMKDPAIVQANQDKAAVTAASAIAKQAGIESHDVAVGLKDLKSRRKALEGIVPSLAESPDYDSARAAIDSHFEDQLQSPEATTRKGFFNTGELTDTSIQYRNQVEQQRAEAHAQLEDIETRRQQVEALQQQADARTAQARALQGQLLDRQLAKARAAGVQIPELNQGEPEASAQPTAQQAPPAPFKPEDAPFRQGEDGMVTFDPSRLVTGLSAARDAGIIQQAQFDELLPKAQAAERALAEEQQFLANDNIASKLKALGVGATKGAAFLAGAPLGAGVGGSIGAPGGVTALAGAAIGGMITGGIAAWSADKILHKLGEYSSTVKSFTDAADAHPMYDAAGNLVAFGVGIPKAGMQLVATGIRAAAPAGEGIVARGAQAAARGYESSGGGVVTTVKNLAEDASLRTAAGASATQVGKALGARVGGYAAANVAIDTVLKEGSKALGFSDEGQTLPGATQAALIGAFVSGHGIKFRDVPPEDIASAVVKRRLNQPMSPAEQEIVAAFDGEVTKLQSEGKLSKNLSGEEQIDVMRRTTGRQASSNGQTYGVTALKIGPESGTASRPGVSQPHLPNSPQTPSPSPAEQSQRPLSPESAYPASPSGPDTKSDTSSYPVVTPPGADGQQRKDALTDGDRASNNLLTGRESPEVRGRAASAGNQTPSAQQRQSSIQQPSVVEPGQAGQPAGATESPAAPAEGEITAELAQREQEFESLPEDVDPAYRNALRGRIQELRALQLQQAKPIAPTETATTSGSSQATDIPSQPLPPAASQGGDISLPDSRATEAATQKTLPVAERGIETPPAEPKRRDWGDIVPSDDINATIETKSGKTGKVLAVTKNVVKFQRPDGKKDASHIKNARVVSPIGDTTTAEPPKVAKAKRFVVRYTGDTFTEDPIISTIIEHGGLMSKSTAKGKWEKAKWAANQGEWDDAPKLSHPTHNSVYKKNGLQPDEMVTALVEAGHLPETATVADLWAAVNRASIGGASMRKQTAAASAGSKLREQQVKRFTKDVAKKDKGEQAIAVEDLHIGDTVKIGGETLKVTGLDPDDWSVTLEDHEKYGIQSVHDGAVIYGRLERRGGSESDGLVKEEGTRDLFAIDGTNTGKEATVTNEAAGTLVRMGGQVVATLRQKGGEFIAEMNAAGKALAHAQRAEVYRAAKRYTKDWQAAEVRDGLRKPLAGGEVRSQSDLLDSGYAEDPLFQQPAKASTPPKETGVQRIRRMIGDGARLFEGEERPVDDAAIQTYLDRHGITKPGAAEELRSLVTVRADSPEYSQLSLGLFSQQPLRASGGGTGAAGQVGGRGAAGLSDEALAARREENRGIADPTGNEAMLALKQRGSISSIIPELVAPNATVWDVRGATIATPEDAFKLLQAVRSPYVESLKVAVLDDSMTVVHSEIVSIGGLNESIAHPRDILRALSRIQQSTGARRLLVAHNHPSGDPTPSDADTRLTRKLEALADELGFKFADHVITNGDKYYSFRQQKVSKVATSDVQLQPWETASRGSLIKLDPEQATPTLIAALRNSDPNAGHILYLSTRHHLLGIERLENLRGMDRGELNKRIAAGAMREGAYGIILHYPGELDRMLIHRLRDFGDLSNIRITDVVFQDGNRGQLSAAESGLVREQPADSEGANEDAFSVQESPFEYAKDVVDRVRKMFTRETLSPGDALLIGHIIPREFARLYNGAADTLKRTKSTSPLGEAVEHFVDRERELGAKVDKPFSHLLESLSKKDRENALDEFKKFNGEYDRSPDGKHRAEEALKTFSPAGQKLVEEWDKMASFMGNHSVAIGMHTQDADGSWRPMRKVQGRYFPRSINQEFLNAIQDPTGNPSAWRKVIEIMKEEGFGKSDAEVLSYFRNNGFSGESSNDFFGNLEKARTLKLPNRLYDYSFSAAVRYMQSWATRTAQVEAFGQSRGKGNPDLFERYLSETIDKRTQEFIAAVRDRVYGVTPRTMGHRVLQVLNSIATGTMLSNPVTSMANLIGGTIDTMHEFGVHNTLSGAAQIASLSKLAAEIRDARDIGVLREDLMNMASDADSLGSNFVSKVSDAAGAALKYTGYNAVESFNRSLGLAASKAFLRAANEAHRKDSNSRKAQTFTAFMKSNGIDAAKVYQENGSGPETERFHRTAVNEAQGGYKINQVPPWIDSPIGRFLFKFQKWGSQQTRLFMRRAIGPAREFVQSKGKSGSVVPLLRYMLLTGVAGLTLEQLRETLFGTPKKSSTIDQIARTASVDQARAWMLAGQKLWNAWMISSAGGLLSNYAQMTLDITQRSRAKNPLSPPGVASITNAGELLFRAIEQHELTAKDIDDYVTSQLSLYRTMKQAGGKFAAATGAPVLKNEQARQDQAWLSSQTLKFAKEAGVEASRTSLGRVGKTTLSPEKRDVMDALRLGDVPAARAALKAYLAEAPEGQRDAYQKSLAASVRASAPIRVGAAGEARRELFLRWAIRNLSADDMRRVRTIDTRYRDTAKKIGLFNPKPLSSKTMATTVAKLGLSPKRSVRWADL